MACLLNLWRKGNRSLQNCAQCIHVFIWFWTVHFCTYVSAISLFVAKLHFKRTLFVLNSLNFASLKAKYLNFRPIFVFEYTFLTNLLVLWQWIKLYPIRILLYFRTFQPIYQFDKYVKQRCVFEWAFDTILLWAPCVILIKTWFHFNLLWNKNKGLSSRKNAQTKIRNNR